MVDGVVRSGGDIPSHANPDETVGYGSLPAPWGFAARFVPHDLVGYWMDVIALTAGRTGVLLGCCGAANRTAHDQSMRHHARAELLRSADPARSLRSLGDVALSALCAVIDGHTMRLSTRGRSYATISAPGTAPATLTVGAGEVAVSPLAAGATVVMSTEPIGSPASLLGDCAGVHPDHVADRVIGRLAGAEGVAAVLYRHPPEPLRVSMPADPASLAISRGLLRDWLTAAGLDSETAADVLLAAGEATANATEHAVLGATGPVQIILEAELSDSRLQLRVTDDGNWKPATAFPGHRGHGMNLMEALMDSVELTTGSPGTSVTMVKELPR